MKTFPSWCDLNFIHSAAPNWEIQKSTSSYLLCIISWCCVFMVAFLKAKKVVNEFSSQGVCSISMRKYWFDSFFSLSLSLFLKSSKNSYSNLLSFFLKKTTLKCYSLKIFINWSSWDDNASIWEEKNTFVVNFGN